MQTNEEVVCWIRPLPFLAPKERWPGNLAWNNSFFSFADKHLVSIKDPSISFRACLLVKWDVFWSLIRECWIKPIRSSNLLGGIFFFFFFLTLCHTACRILAPWPGMENMPLPLGVWILNHWTSSLLSLNPGPPKAKFITYPLTVWQYFTGR